MTKTQKLPVEEARKKFADLLDGSQFRGEHTEITRRGKPAGYLVPPDWWAAATEALAEIKALRKGTATPNKAASVVAAPRQRVTQAVSEPITLSAEELRTAGDLARSRAMPNQLRQLEDVARRASDADRDLAVVEEAYRIGLLKDADFA